ncbi:MAG: hypothetical protein Ta2A_15350 [Treponemataceae bacterium]|nr:MAG: hypothetical protein Ta2A_15350 [Treponemataceae bacterium]
MSIKNRTAAVCILSSVFSLLFLLSGCFDSGDRIKGFLSEIDRIGNGYAQNAEATPPPGSGFECYVSNSGNDYYDGTQATPVKTLGRAAQILRAKNVETKTAVVLNNLTSTATDSIGNTGKQPIIITTDGGVYTCAAQLVIGAGATVKITEKIAFPEQLTVSGNLTLSGAHTAAMTVYLTMGRKITLDGFSNSAGVMLIPAVYNTGLQVVDGSSSDFAVQNQISSGNTIAWTIDSNCLKPEAEYYVSDIGDDANDGLSSATPFKTLRYAFNLVVSIHGAQDKKIHIAGTLDFSIEGASGGDSNSVFVLNTNSIDTITIIGGTLSASGSPPSYKRVVHIKRGKIKFEGVAFSDGNGVTEGAGIYIENVNSVVELDSACSFSNNTTTTNAPTSGKDIFKKEGTLKIGADVSVGVSSQLGGTDNVYVVL